MKYLSLVALAGLVVATPGCFNCRKKRTARVHETVVTQQEPVVHVEERISGVETALELK